MNLTDPTGHFACGDGIDDPRCDQYNPQKHDNSSVLGTNVLDYVPVVVSVRRFIRGSQTADLVSHQPGFIDEQKTYQTWVNNCYGACHGASPEPDSPLGGPMPDVPLVDAYSQAMGEAAGGAIDLLQTVAVTGFAQSATQTRPFTQPKPNWHLGLEYGNKMNIAHVGNQSGRGVHIAFGSISPKFADLHIYVYPDVYLWRPSWGPNGEIHLWSWPK